MLERAIIEPERNHGPVPGPLEAGSGPEPPQLQVSSIVMDFYLHVADMAGNLSISGRRKLCSPTFFTFRELPVPSRSVNSAQAIRPDPYRASNPDPGTIPINHSF